MPNWCAGSLKFRGKSTDILRFFKEGLTLYRGRYDQNGNYVRETVDKDIWLNIDEYKTWYEIYLDTNSDDIFIEGTDRAYIQTNFFSQIVLDKGDNVVLYCEVMQAWDFRVNDWVKIAQTYNLDIRLYGIDGLGGFVHQIDILDGQIARDQANNYGSYDGFVWNCPFPWIGG